MAPRLPHFTRYAPKGAFHFGDGPAMKIAPTLPRFTRYAAPQGDTFHFGDGPAMKRVTESLWTKVFTIYSFKIATARTHPAELCLILMGKQLS
ncbi:hypothetical protein ABIE13_002068 [Ottowia thiooxydans]|uniref:Uncharacterized protein n=1 Tax=Ottowia thiooxydans TaxID=219182 RepID=A0ABV2Q8P4_9BURK